MRGETIKTDFRLIVATNHDLKKAVADKRFREDLYYRINTITFTLPPLRDRKSDIPELTSYFIRKYSKVVVKKIKGITEKTLKVLVEYPWPGNIRELDNLIHRSVVFCTRQFLCVYCCVEIPSIEKNSKDQKLKEMIESLVELTFEEGTKEKYQSILNWMEIAIVKKALERTGGNQVQAAKLLGISRNTLRKKWIRTLSECVRGL